MAANWKSGTGAITGLGKRLLNRTSPRHPTSPPPASAAATTFRRVHASAYDKNLDDQLHPTAVPDDVIQPQSDKYWAPHPQTGVFGPATEIKASAGGEQGGHPSRGNDGVNSVLEENAWFRPTSIEDLEKPHQL